MPNPLVSVLINNCNYGRYLSAAIESAFQPDYDNIEVVVVDDGSTDESRDVIASFGKQIIPVLKRNGGQASAFNAGFANSRGEIVCFLDSDDLFLPGKIAAVVEGIRQVPGGWCFHRQQWVDKTAQQDLGTAKTPRDYCTGIYDLRDSFRSGTTDFWAPATSGLSFSRDLLGRMLPVSEKLRIYSDNYLKFCAFALSPGYYYYEFLGLQRIHDNNAGTGKTVPMYRANWNMKTSCALRERFPELAPIWDRIFFGAVREKWAEGGQPEELLSDVCGYLSVVPLVNWPALLARVAYRASTRTLRAKSA